MNVINLLLADDDKDDCFLFQEALEELDLPVDLTMVNDGEQLMKTLSQKEEIPGLLFLDINMPRKNGFECLTEIKQSERLKDLPVIIFSTALQPDMVTLLRNKGAQHYIRKPTEFIKLKQLIEMAIGVTVKLHSLPLVKADFVLTI